MYRLKQDFSPRSIKGFRICMKSKFALPYTFHGFYCRTSCDSPQQMRKCFNQNAQKCIWPSGSATSCWEPWAFLQTPKPWGKPLRGPCESLYKLYKQQVVYALQLLCYVLAVNERVCMVACIDKTSSYHPSHVVCKCPPCNAVLEAPHDNMHICDHSQ